MSNVTVQIPASSVTLCHIGYSKSDTIAHHSCVTFVTFSSKNWTLACPVPVSDLSDFAHPHVPLRCAVCAILLWYGTAPPVYSEKPAENLPNALELTHTGPHRRGVQYMSQRTFVVLTWQGTVPPRATRYILRACEICGLYLVYMYDVFDSYFVL
jgi:hypothetical protein